MFSRYIAAVLCALTLFAGSAAHAVSWPQIGAACTPERAQPWDASRSEINQAACHCPPPEYCPTTYAQYRGDVPARMPHEFVARCNCPVIAPPTCADGTVHAGEVYPDINDSASCNRCPVSDHTNQDAASLGGLNPVVENCWDHCPGGSYYAGMRVEQVPNRNCSPALCPPNTMGAGGLAPNGDINQCAPLCTYGSLIGQVRPADNECDPQFCPPGTQHAGARMYPTTDCGYYCPGGTYYQGSLVNSVPNGNCSPNLCPPGTTGEGQPAPNNDPGQCPRPVAQCPAKYYPSMNEAGMGSVPYGEGGSYTYQNGATFNFSGESIALAYYQDNAETKALAGRFGYSIRSGIATYWQLGPGGMCAALGGGWCPYENFYIPNSGGLNNAERTLADVVANLGADNLAWFGFSVADRRYLGDNLATPNILAAFNGNERLEIRNHSCPIGLLCDANPNIAYNIPEALRYEAAQFTDQCDKAAGEFVELEWKNVGGTQCAYLQCRYVYENTAESCLTGDTGITLADGKVKKVSELKLGDVVKGSDGDHKITASNIYQSALRVMYGVNGSDAMLTGDHPIRTTEGWKVITDEAAKLYADKPGFATATKLAVGDTLITEKGEVKVTEIKRFANVEPISTYNIRVEGNNGFYANGIEVRGFDKMEMHY